VVGRVATGDGEAEIVSSTAPHCSQISSAGKTGWWQTGHIATEVYLLQNSYQARDGPKNWQIEPLIKQASEQMSKFNVH
jgi:hypothetical protein